MAELRVLTTAEVSAPLLAELRTLVDRAFAHADPEDAFGHADDAFGEDDWHHALGGWHVVLDAAGGAVVAHAAVVPRLIDVDGRTLRAGYVEAVATDPAHQGQGLGSQVMGAVTDVLHGHFELGALSTGRHGFYGRVGWERWRGPTFVRHGDQLVRSEDEDDGVMVLRFGASAEIDLATAITCRARPGDDW